MLKAKYSEEPIRVAIYARVSSDAQDVNNSIEAQIGECKLFARNNNMVVVAIFIDEAESGRSDNRPQFQQMVTEAISKDKPFEVVLVWKFSRFSRDRVDNAIYKNRLKKRGVRIVSIKEPTDDSPAGQFMEGVIEEVDAFYSANLSQEVRRGQRKVAERGYYPGNRAPYGYKLEKIREDDGNSFHNIFVKDPDTAPIVGRIFDEAIAGRTYTDIREGLNRDRVPPPEPKNKKDAKSKKWRDSTLYSVLHNLHHAGFIVWGVNSQSGDPPVVAKGRHEPIVSEDEFNLAGRVMASKAREVAHPKQTASVYMLSRMLQCQHCGETLIVRPSKLQTSRYYQCRTRRHEGVEVCDCPNLNIQKLDERVLRVVLDDILCPSNVQVAISKMSEELTQPYEEKHAVLQAIERELADLNVRQSRVMEAYEAGVYTVDDYSRRMAPLRATEADLQKKRAETARELDQQTAVLAKPEEILQFTSQLSDFLGGVVKRVCSRSSLPGVGRWPSTTPFSWHNGSPLRATA